MAVLAESEIERGIKQGHLIKNPRIVNGKYADLQGASYDLTAGVAVWRESGKSGIDGATREARSIDDVDRHQPTVELQPGQMMSIITKEELAIPADVCATVYSKNTIALKGIFAFNAGHVDPGYHGPIIIRVLNLRRTKLTITMGQPVFLVVFEKLEGELHTARRPSFTHDQALLAVREFANDALSNALFELYAGAIEERLDDHRNSLLEKVRSEFDGKFVQVQYLHYHLWVTLGIVMATLVGLAAAFVNIVSRWPDFMRVLRSAGWP